MTAPLLGVVGGPLVTVDFLDKLGRLTPATRDQEHISRLVVGIPQMPSRTLCILRHDDAQFEHLLVAVPVGAIGGMHDKRLQDAAMLDVRGKLGRCMPGPLVYFLPFDHGRMTAAPGYGIQGQGHPKASRVNGPRRR